MPPKIIIFPNTCLLYIWSSEKVHDFKCQYLIEFQTKVRNDNLNARKRKTLDRNSAILILVRQYDDLLTVQQNDTNTNANWAFKLGKVTPNPGHELIETPEIFSDEETE